MLLLCLALLSGKCPEVFHIFAINLSGRDIKFYFLFLVDKVIFLWLKKYENMFYYVF